MFEDMPCVKKILFTKEDRTNLVSEFEKMFMQLNSNKSYYSFEEVKEKYPNIKELFDMIRL
jgi:hypothetical protein